MKEHHVETAFKEHAKNYHCEKFQLSRRDFADLGLPHKISTGTADIEITGQYDWCGRLFRFRSDGHTDGFVGGVLVEAYLHQAVLIGTLSVACSLNQNFPGYSTVIYATDIPEMRKLGPFFWGIGTRLPDLHFSEITVNAISASLDVALSRFEDEMKISKRGKG